jgi:hypothetical protein
VQYRLRSRLADAGLITHSRFDLHGPIGTAPGWAFFWVNSGGIAACVQPGELLARNASSRLSSAENHERIVERAWVIGESKGNE